jgi:hypothetical protein
VEQVTAKRHPANNGPSLRLELHQLPPDPPELAPSPTPGALEADSATDPRDEAGISGQSASPRVPCSIGGHPLSVRPFPNSFYRPRFLVLPTGRTIFAWGIWDTQKNPGAIPNRPFQMSEFLHRTRSLAKAYAFARRLNEKHEAEVAA